MYSLSVLDRATVCCCLEDQEMGLLVRWKTYPEKESPFDEWEPPQVALQKLSSPFPSTLYSRERLVVLHK